MCQKKFLNPNSIKWHGNVCAGCFIYEKKIHMQNDICMLPNRCFSGLADNPGKENYLSFIYFKQESKETCRIFRLKWVRAEGSCKQMPCSDVEEIFFNNVPGLKLIAVSKQMVHYLSIFLSFFYSLTIMFLTNL